jgi:hypothetical protein
VELKEEVYLVRDLMLDAFADPIAVERDLLAAEEHLDANTVLEKRDLSVVKIKIPRE